SGPPAVFLTTFSPDPADPSTIAYAAWFRSDRTQLALYPGYKGPGPSALPRGPEMVPPAARSRLLATFNSGFYEADSPGGFYVHGELFHPMIRGLATVVQYRDGRVDVARWRGGPRPRSDIVVARQNMPLFVVAGRPNPSLDVSERWGVTLHGAPAVWRTALGVDRRGNLIYVAAANQTAPSLAQLLIRVGAVRGMQLDINPEWPILVTYGGRGASAPKLFVPNPNQIPNRFLYSSTKDFFAIYTRRGVPVITPW
ncbi:MAG: phosphodiester glycosidase family protein, partial [Gaiellales bacterium]